jgi:hypothetical protein
MPCNVVFGATSEGKTSLRLDMDADEVGRRLRDAAGIERFEDAKGAPIWINPANVLYVESRTGKTGRAASF